MKESTLCVLLVQPQNRYFTEVQHWFKSLQVSNHSGILYVFLLFTLTAGGNGTDECSGYIGCHGDTFVPLLVSSRKTQHTKELPIEST